MGQPPQYEFMVALDAEDRKDKPLPLVRITARIEPEWLIDQFPDRVREQSSVLWNRATERVDAISMLLYDDLVIQESRGAVPEPQAAAELLAKKAAEAGIERFVDQEKLDQFLSRLEFAGFEQPDLQQTLRELCFGLASFAELKDTGACIRLLPNRSDYTVDARRRFTMNAASNRGLHPVCRTSSACARHPG
jgi:ATP-dependent helicase HrpB